MSKSCFLNWLVFPLTILGVASVSCGQQPLVPGIGTRIDYVGDNFEDTHWSFIHNHPKSSREEDNQLRFPVGKSVNGRWYEGPERGQPDSMQIVPTPPGGLAGSQYALLVRTLNSGIPGHRSFDVQQDDLIVDCITRIGTIPVSESPSAVTRVYLPPADQWENRSGPHFGFRGTCTTTVWKTEENNSRFRFRPPQRYQAKEQYWPGIWIHFRSETDDKVSEDSAYLTVRGNNRGFDYMVREIPKDQFGWWTLGLSFTPDGRVHYYAKPGVDDLTEEDHLATEFPYSYRAERFETMFYNFCNLNDGKTWSTPFVIDEPQLFVLRAERVQSLVEQKRKMTEEQAERARQKQEQELIYRHAAQGMRETRKNSAKQPDQKAKAEDRVAERGIRNPQVR